MRAVVREPEPETLKNWERDGQRLCEALNRYHKKERKTRPEADATIYRAPDVLAALQKMFQGRCAYCESVIPGKLDVEHFRPESLYPAIAYKWTNLLFACAFCNQGDAKGAKFPLQSDGRQPVYDAGKSAMLDDTDLAMLINPCEENPEDFFEFVGATLGCKNERAKKMREVCKLDRSDLQEERERHLKRVKSALIGLETALLLPDEPERQHWEEELKAFLGWGDIPVGGHGEPYTMMTYAYLKDNKFRFEDLES